MPSPAKELLFKHSQLLIVVPVTVIDQPVNVSFPNVIVPRVLSSHVELSNGAGHVQPPSTRKNLHQYLYIYSMSELVCDTHVDNEERVDLCYSTKNCIYLFSFQNARLYKSINFLIVVKIFHLYSNRRPPSLVFSKYSKDQTTKENL